MFGGEANTTNNRMELMAVIAALEALKRPCQGCRAHRLAICSERHQRVDPRLEEKKLDDCREDAREKRRPVEAARYGRPAA